MADARPYDDLVLYEVEATGLAKRFYKGVKNHFAKYPQARVEGVSVKRMRCLTSTSGA